MKRTMDYVIGVDIGTQSTKALLVGADGKIVASESQAYQVDTRSSSSCTAISTRRSST